jgi:hypothetical protein
MMTRYVQGDPMALDKLEGGEISFDHRRDKRRPVRISTNN